MYFDATDPANEAKRVYELYDLHAQPPELNNLADSNPDKLAEMKAKLEVRMEETHTVPALEG